MADNKFLTVAKGTGATVLTDAEYAALGAISGGLGFQAGVFPPEQFNKVARQASTISAMIGQFIVDKAIADANDGQTVAAIEANFIAALTAVIQDVTETVIEVFTTPGTHSWVCPAGVFRVKRTVTGAGGGGGGSTSSQGSASGGAGGTAIGWVDVVPGTTYTIVVGAPGTGGASGGGSGNTGGSSSALGATGIGGNPGLTGLTSGDGGGATGGDINVYGGDGADPVTGSVGSSTNGGASYWGGGRSGGSSVTPASLAPGSGGAGAYSLQHAGGDGAPGISTLEY